MYKAVLTLKLDVYSWHSAYWSCKRRTRKIQSKDFWKYGMAKWTKTLQFANKMTERRNDRSVQNEPEHRKGK